MMSGGLFLFFFFVDTFTNTVRWTCLFPLRYAKIVFVYRGVISRTNRGTVNVLHCIEKAVGFRLSVGLPLYNNSLRAVHRDNVQRAALNIRRKGGIPVRLRHIQRRSLRDSLPAGVPSCTYIARDSDIIARRCARIQYIHFDRDYNCNVRPDCR